MTTIRSFFQVFPYFYSYDLMNKCISMRVRKSQLQKYGNTEIQAHS